MTWVGGGWGGEICHTLLTELCQKKIRALHPGVAASQIASIETHSRAHLIEQLKKKHLASNVEDFLETPIDKPKREMALWTRNLQTCNGLFQSTWAKHIIDPEDPKEKKQAEGDIKEKQWHEKRKNSPEDYTLTPR